MTLLKKRLDDFNNGLKLVRNIIWWNKARRNKKKQNIFKSNINETFLFDLFICFVFINETNINVFVFYVKHLQLIKTWKLQSPGIYLCHMPGLYTYIHTTHKIYVHIYILAYKNEEPKSN